MWNLRVLDKIFHAMCTAIFLLLLLFRGGNGDPGQPASTEQSSAPSAFQWHGTPVLWQLRGHPQPRPTWLHSRRTQSRWVSFQRVQGTWGFCLQPFQRPHMANLIRVKTAYIGRPPIKMGVLMSSFGFCYINILIRSLFYTISCPETKKLKANNKTWASQMLAAICFAVSFTKAWSWELLPQI